MLYYLGSGERNYAEQPVRAYGRPYWEFQAVLSGRIAMASFGEGGDFRSSRLWLSAPGHVHGWKGLAGRPAEVAVFQFLSVPEHLARMVPPKGCLEVPLGRANIRRLRELADLVQNYWRRPGPEMLLRSEHALLELSLLVIESSGRWYSGQEKDAARRRVQKAIDWFAAHMGDNPGLDEVARASGSSISHLRRHFYEVMRSSPKKIFDQLRFQRATQLMADPETKLASVGEACGFGSPSAFSRAFKSRFGVPPENWRGRPLD